MTGTDPLGDSLALLPAFLAGLVFFFLGLDRVKGSLRGVASRGARRRAAAIVSSPVRAAGLGMAVGALTQSATAVSFIVAGLVSAGLVTIRRALTIVAWANPGTALLPFLAAVDLTLATLWLIGIVGLALRSRRIAGSGALLGALFGIGLLLFGLIQLKAAAAPIQEAPWFGSFAALLAGPLPIAFAIGALLRVAIQSSSGIAVIVIVLCGQSVLDVEHALMTIHGTGIGIGLTVLLLARTLRGEALRVAWWQALLNAIAATILGAWLLIASLTDIPSLVTILAGTGLPVESQLALAFLLQMLLCPLVAVLIGARGPAILTRLVPESAEDELARPRYLDESALDLPDLGLELAAREQLRIVGALPALLDPGRTDLGARSGLDAREVRPALEALCREVEGFVADLVRRNGGDLPAAGLLEIGSRQRSIGELVETIGDLGREAAPRDGVETPPLAAACVEAADLVLHILADVLRSGDPDDRSLLLALTTDRGDQLEAIRAQAAGVRDADAAEQARELYLISLLERSAWLVRRIAQQAPAGQASAAGPVPATGEAR